MDCITKKLFWKYLKSKFPAKLAIASKLLGYVFLPLFIVVFIRTFFFDIYKIPSSSMKATLFPKDYVLINKFYYGSKVPKKLRHIPIIGSLVRTNEKNNSHDLFSPLPGFESFKRDDIVVFHSVSQNENFIVKRIIGAPGDIVKIINAQVFVNGIKLEEKNEYCYNYVDYGNGEFRTKREYSNQEYLQMTEEKKSQWRKDTKKVSKRRSTIFPDTKRGEWTRDNYGELAIPKKGKTIFLNRENIDIYGPVIQKYENVDLTLTEQESGTYTFKQNYYFLLGDNRHNSIDSRYFGFVPESYIQGKMIAVLAIF